VPTDLAAIVLVESGGNPTALSPKGARGLWQLMPQTARRYGLIVDGQTDERLDISKSTRAAAEYLRDLFAQFHSWPLALAAYNAGEQAVQRAVSRTGSDTFSLAAAALPRETQGYVPAVLAFLPRFSAVSLNRTANISTILYAAAGQ
jgi:membrane-bound lytic murein transglycosylase D